MRKLFLVYIVTACMMVTVVFAGPPREVWNKTYDSGYGDKACGVAVDTLGNVYVTGYFHDVRIRGCRTIKYNSDGNIQWNMVYVYDSGDTNYNRGRSKGIAVDALGNAYVIGDFHGLYVSENGFFTIKYDTDGNVLWNKIYTLGRDHYDYASDVAVDVLGNVYVTSYSEGGHGYDDYVHLIKYSTDGNLQWQKSRTDGRGGDVCTDVAVDALGNVYVTISSYVGIDDCFYTTKYDTDGNIQWENVYYLGCGIAHDVAVDDLGNVYVIASFVVGEYHWDCRMIKYDTDGNIQWDKSYDDYVSYIAVDAEASVYVAGSVSGEEPPYPTDYCTIRYDSEGSFQWKKFYDSGYTDEVRGVAVDALYYVYVTGYSFNGIDYDYRTIKYEQDDIPAVVEQPKADNPQLKVLKNITSNPVLQYMLPPNANGNLVLYSSDGRVVEKLTLTEPESSITFDCSLPSGVYFAKLTTELSSTIAKVVLVK